MKDFRPETTVKAFVKEILADTPTGTPSRSFQFQLVRYILDSGTGNSCRQPAMTKGRCRMLTGNSRGPPKGIQNALNHGKRIKQLFKKSKELLKQRN